MVRFWKWMPLAFALATLVVFHGCSGRAIDGSDGLDIHGPDSKEDTVAADRGLNKPADCHPGTMSQGSGSLCMITVSCPKHGGYKYECIPVNGGLECTCLGLSIVEKKFKTTGACNWHLASPIGTPLCWTGIVEELKANCGWSFGFSTCPFGGK
jgi:hypothetical protein